MEIISGSGKKKVIPDLKLKIQNEDIQICSTTTTEKSDEGTKVLLAESVEEQPANTVMDEGHLQQPSVLMEFELFKANLSGTTGDLAAIRGTVDVEII